MCHEADALESAWELRKALERAEAAIPFFSDSIAYQRRFLKIEPRLPDVGRILRLAPPLFAHRTLAALQTYCDCRKKLERETIPELADRIEQARRELSHAVGLWARLFDNSPSTMSDTLIDHTARSLCEIWRAMGVIQYQTEAASNSEVGARIVPTTQLRRNVRAKCSGCGKRGQAPTERFLEPRTCPSCKQRGWFVIYHRGI